MATPAKTSQSSVAQIAPPGGSPKRPLIDLIIGNPITVAGIIGMFADVIGVAAWAARLLFQGDASQLWVQLVVLVTLFVFAVGLVLLGTSITKVDSAQKIMQAYTHTFSILAAFTYLCMSYILSSASYEGSTYLGFWILMLAELGGFLVLRLVSRTRDQGWFAVPLITATLCHYILLVWKYPIIHAPVVVKVLLENVGFVLFMTLVSGGVYALSDLPGSLLSRTRRTKLRG